MRWSPLSSGPDPPKRNSKFTKSFVADIPWSWTPAFNSKFKEGRTKTYKLDDVRPSTFRLFVQYLYARKATLQSHNPDPEDDLNPSTSPNHSVVCSEQDMNLVELWVLAERFLVPRLQNQIVDHMEAVKQQCEIMNPECFAYIYENTTSDKPLRRLVVDMLTWANVDDKYFNDNSNDIPHAMLIDMVNIYHKAAPTNVRNRQASKRECRDCYV